MAQVPAIPYEFDWVCNEENGEEFNLVLIRLVYWNANRDFFTGLIVGEFIFNPVPFLPCVLAIEHNVHVNDD